MKMFNSLSIELVGSEWVISAHVQSEDITLVDSMVLEGGFDSEEEAQIYLDGRMRDMF